MLARDHGADLIYSSGNKLSRFVAMSEVGIPVAGHVGLVPIRATWLGGLRAVGKTVDEAVHVYRETLAFEELGAVAVEMECVPAAIAAEITKRTKLLTLSLGSGPACDGQFLFSSDMLGIFEGRYPGLTRPYDGPFPRHAKRYADLHGDAVRAFEAFAREVEGGEFPGPNNVIGSSDRVRDEFLAADRENSALTRRAYPVGAHANRRACRADRLAAVTATASPCSSVAPRSAVW